MRGVNTAQKPSYTPFRFQTAFYTKQDMITGVIGVLIITIICLLVLLAMSIRRTSAYRDIAHQSLQEAMAWRERAALSEHEARLAKQDRERIRISYCKIIGRARASRYGQYPVPE